MKDDADVDRLAGPGVQIEIDVLRIDLLRGLAIRACGLARDRPRARQRYGLRARAGRPLTL